MLISFQCQTLLLLAINSDSSSSSISKANKRAQAIFCLRHARAKQKRRQTAANNNNKQQTLRQPQQSHSCNVSAADTVSQRYAYAALGHCVKLDRPPAVHLLLVAYLYLLIHMQICVCDCVSSVLIFYNNF